MSARDFSAALEEFGVRCDVEAQERLAILVLRSPVSDSSLRVAQSDERAAVNRRRAIVALGRSHGFTNVCIELPADAPVSGD